MKARAAKRAAAERREALWTFYLEGNARATELVPVALRRMTLPDAMEILAAQRDERAVERGARGLYLIIRGAGIPRPIFEIFFSPSAKQAARDKAAINLAAQLAAAFDISASVVAAFVGWIAPGVAQLCFDANSDSTWDQKNSTSTFKAGVRVKRPLDDAMVRLLDPRGWQHSGDLFEETFQVEEVDGEYEPVPATELGCPWQGRLWERANLGPQALDNVLTIDFRVKRTDSKGGKRVERVDIQYDLYDNPNYEIGGFELAGIMRQNWGIVTVEPDLHEGNDWTKVMCSKTVNYGRMTRWNAAGPFDYGEILNYMAPSLLTLWVDEVRFAVPCGKRDTKG